MLVLHINDLIFFTAMMIELEGPQLLIQQLELLCMH